MGGGQFKQALKAIIEAESQPVRNLEARKAREEARLKLFQEFKGKFSGIDKAIQEVGSFKKMRELKVDLGDGANVASVTVDKERAHVGAYEVEIEQLAGRTSVMSNGFESADDPVLGLGYVVMQGASGQTIEIFVDEEKSSLRGVAELVNAHPDSPVRASVVQDMSQPDAPWKIIFAAKKEGEANQISFPDLYFLDGTQDFYVDYDHEAQNALIRVDGFPIEAAGNTIQDFMPGVNLTLKQARPGQPITINITEDLQKVSGKVKNMVDQLNGVLDFILQQNKVDQTTDTRNTFTGDTSLQTIEFRIRNLMHEGFPVYDTTGEITHIVHMNEIGIEFDKTGRLGFKEERFTKMMEKDFEGISQAISGEMGFASQLRTVMTNYTAGGGLLATREQGLKSRIRDIDAQIENKTRLIEKKTQALTEQFSRLQGSLSNLQRQQQYMAAALPGAGGGGNMIAQLLGG